MYRDLNIIYKLPLSSYFNTIILFIVSNLLLLCNSELVAQTPEFSWVKGFGGNGTYGNPVDYGEAIAVDDSGYVYVTGSFFGTANFNPGGDSVLLTATGLSQDIFVGKFDSLGNCIWVKRLGGASLEISKGIAVDNSGNIFITGYFNGISNFDPEGKRDTLIAVGQDIFVAKYSSVGDYIWSKRLGGSSTDQGMDIAVDNKGSVYLTGYFISSTADFNPGGAGGIIATSGGQDIFIAKYADNGAYQWAKSIGGVGHDIGNSIAVDSLGNVFITGRFSSVVVQGIDTLKSAGGTDAFIVNYSTEGDYLWSKAIGGVANEDGWGIIIDIEQNVCIAGSLSSPTVDFNPGGNGGLVARRASAVRPDAFTAKYSRRGAFQWCKVMGGIYDDHGYALSTDVKGNVYVTGTMQTPSSFYADGGGDTLVGKGGEDIFIVGYSGDGNYLWSKSTGGPLQDRSRKIAVDNKGNLYITGFFKGSANFDATGSYDGMLTASGSEDIFLLKLSPYASNCNTFSQVSASACDSYTYNGQTYTSSGVYTQTRLNAANCDSVIMLDLTIYNSSVRQLFQTSCESYTLNGQTYTSSGVYTQTIQNAGQCDSVIMLQLTINKNTTSILERTACNSYTLNGQTYTASGVYTQTSTNSKNCDSIITLNLTINSNVNTTVKGQYCDSATFNGITYTTSGTYVQPYKNVSGCDSNITYDLTIDKSSESTVFRVNACDSFIFNGITYHTSGLYNISLPQANGCDSLVSLDLVIETIEAKVIQIDTLLLAGSATSYQWVDCDRNYAAIPGASDQEFVPSESGRYAVIVANLSCRDTSVCIAVSISGESDIKQMGIRLPGLRLYPNPAHDIVHLVSENFFKDARIRVVNLLGVQLQEHKISFGKEYTLDLSEYAAGIYFIDVGYENSMMSRLKLVKQ